jgi:Holliday junction resolvasome RuvABC DNA-binding subunit
MKTSIIILCIFVSLAGCNSTSQPQPQSENISKEREETKKLEAASAVGYDGKAIRKSVDNTLNKNDDHNRDMDKAIKSDAEK